MGSTVVARTGGLYLSPITLLGQGPRKRHTAYRFKVRNTSACPLRYRIVAQDSEKVNSTSEKGEAESLEMEVVHDISKIPPEEWDECAESTCEYTGEGTNPFISHSFLAALEESGSVKKKTGWLPCHIIARTNKVSMNGEKDSDSQGSILGIMPLYLKGHSYGEYVFDHSWANAYMMHGLRYYPKLQSCVPFTPVTGPRMLLSKRVLHKDESYRKTIRLSILGGIVQIADQLEASSVHITFPTREEWNEGSIDSRFMRRSGVQYHWNNNGYNSFDDFLSALQQKKRKTIKQERKKVAAEGAYAVRLHGSEISSKDWDAFYKFYINTSNRKWGSAYLNREFFQMLTEKDPGLRDSVCLVMAKQESEIGWIGGALNLKGSKALFGRNWGCRKFVKNLHFEVCYYQAIEEAIQNGLERVEAGAQGEHKIQRGYLPNRTYSLHYIGEPGFESAIRQYLAQENKEISQVKEVLEQSSPYKSRVFKELDKELV